MKIPGFRCRCALRWNMFQHCRDLAPKIQAPSPLPANNVCAAFLRTPGFARLYSSRATSISTLPVEAGSNRPSRPRWHSDPQAALCRTCDRKRVPQLPRRSAARCNPINAVIRSRLPGQSGSSPRTMLSAWPGVFQQADLQRHARYWMSKNSSSFLGKNLGWAARGRSPQSQRRCGIVEVHVNRYGARCRPRGIRCLPSWPRCGSSSGARGRSV
jgi:hypothetical protein